MGNISELREIMNLSRRKSCFPQQWQPDARDPNTIIDNLKRRESMPAVSDFNRRRLSSSDLGFTPRTSINLTTQDPLFTLFTADEQKEIIQRVRKDQIRNKNDKNKNTPWQVTRHAYSREVATFTLPINLYLIRDLLPLEYMSVYCKVNREEKNYTN